MHLCSSYVYFPSRKMVLAAHNAPCQQHQQTHPLCAASHTSTHANITLTLLSPLVPVPTLCCHPMQLDPCQSVPLKAAAKGMTSFVAVPADQHGVCRPTCSSHPSCVALQRFLQQLLQVRGMISPSFFMIYHHNLTDLNYYQQLSEDSKIPTAPLWWEPGLMQIKAAPAHSALCPCTSKPTPDTLFGVACGSSANSSGTADLLAQLHVDNRYLWEAQRHSP